MAKSASQIIEAFTDLGGTMISITEDLFISRSAKVVLGDMYLYIPQGI